MSSHNRWSIVLAGGDGKRLQPSIQKWLGHPLPKQYCTFAGTRSMLQHTWGRANQIVQPRNKVTVLGSTHRPRPNGRNLGHSEEGPFIFQPRNCDTAPGIFLPLTYVKAWDPQAVVVIFPSDHFIFPEDPFVDTVRRAVRAVEFWQNRMILFGVRPSHLELDYGWITPGNTLGWSDGSCIRHIQEFIEKPEPVDGERLMQQGALWNTFVLVAHVETLWNAGWACIPEVMELFEEFGTSLGTPVEESALHTIYHRMPHRNFSQAVLQPCSQQLGVMELENIVWSDWGRPERILETLQAVGIKPTFPPEIFQEVPPPADQEAEVGVG